MKHRGEALQRAELGHLDGCVLADPRQVVAQQVDDHDVFGPVLLARPQAGGEGGVGQRIAPARQGPLDRPGLDPALVHLEKAFRRRGGQDAVAEAHVGREGRRVQVAQPAIETEGRKVLGQVGAKALRQIGLEDVAGMDVVDHPLHRRLVGHAAEVGGHGGRPRGRCGHRAQGRRGGQPGLEGLGSRPRPGLARGKFLLGQTARQDPGALFVVVVGDDDVVEAERQVGKRHIVDRGRRHPLEVAAQVVAEIAGDAPLERRQPGIGIELVQFELTLEHGEGIAVEDAAVEADPAVPAFHDTERFRRDEGIAA